jgi:hypothetical protein
MEVGSEETRFIDARAETAHLLLDDQGSEFHLPKNFEGFAPVVIVEANRFDQSQLVGLRRRSHALNEPLPVSQSDHVTFLRSLTVHPARGKQLCHAEIARISIICIEQ